MSDINALVAEHVLGWHFYDGERESGWKTPSGSWAVDDFQYDIDIGMDAPPFYSDIEAAWWMLTETFGVVYIEVHNGWREIDGERRSGWTVRIVEHTGEFEGFAETMPMAACIAALRVKGIEVPTPAAGDGRAG